MGWIADLRGFERVEDPEVGNASDAKIDPGGEDNATAQHFGAPGDDSHPLVGIDDVAGVSVPGGKVALGYLDTQNPGEALPGERRLYARTADGTPIAIVWLKLDGTIQIVNDAGSFEMAPGGDVTINGVVIGTDGSVTAPGEVEAMSAAPGASVKVSTHLHGTAMGPTTSPTPGT